MYCVLEVGVAEVLDLLFCCTRFGCTDNGLWTGYLCVLCDGYCCNMCIDVYTLDAGLLARCQCSEGPATGHLDTGFSWFPCVYKQMLRRFPTFQVATTCFSCIPPDVKLVAQLQVLVYVLKTTATG